MPVRFTNLSQTRITDVGGISAAALSVGITAGDGAKIAADVDFAAGEYCYGTFTDVSGNLETIKITNRSTDQLTIVREADGDAARAWAQDDILYFCPNAAALAELEQSAAISANAAAIAANAADIAANAADIADNAAAIALAPSRIGSADLDDEQQATFTGLELGKKYVLDFDVWGLNNGAGDGYLDVGFRFGNASAIDAGNNYNMTVANLQGFTSTTWSGMDQARMTHTAGLSYTYVSGRMEFAYLYDPDLDANVVHGVIDYSISYQTAYKVSFIYQPSGSVDRVQLLADTGNTLTGQAFIRRLN